MNIWNKLQGEQWKLRKEDRPIGSDHATHYVDGVRAAAINTLYSLRGHIERTIFEVAYDPAYRTDTHIDWADSLSKNLLPVFLYDNPKFASKLYPIGDPFAFFDSINDLLRASQEENLKMSREAIADYRNKLGRKISVNEIAPGWSAILREFGFFNPLEGLLSDVYEVIKEPDHRRVETIKDSVLNKINIRSFEASVIVNGDMRDVVCPAVKVVSNIALCTSLNIALALDNQLAEDRFVPFIGNIPPHHFRTSSQMADDYSVFKTGSLPADWA